MAGKILKRLFPEKRIFVKSDEGTRFVRLGTKQQVLALIGGTAMVGWCTVATSFLIIGLISGSGAREGAIRDHALYEARLNTVATARDRQTAGPSRVFGGDDAVGSDDEAAHTTASQLLLRRIAALMMPTME